jgi:hypothetical protein
MTVEFSSAAEPERSMMATSGEPTALWQVAMPVAWAIGLAAAFLVAAAVVCRWADRTRVPTAESLMRWLCD